MKKLPFLKGRATASDCDAGWLDLLEVEKSRHLEPQGQPFCKWLLKLADFKSLHRKFGCFTISIHFFTGCLRFEANVEVTPLSKFDEWITPKKWWFFVEKWHLRLQIWRHFWASIREIPGEGGVPPASLTKVISVIVEGKLLEKVETWPFFLHDKSIQKWVLHTAEELVLSTLQKG